MLIIYTQDGTIIRKDADAAKGDMITLYGKKIGLEAYTAMKSGREGASFRRYGGPLIKKVSPKEAETIKEKERCIGMYPYRTDKI